MNGLSLRSLQIFQEARDEISPLMSLESARWGDAASEPGAAGYSYRKADPGNTPNAGVGGDFLNAADFLGTEYLPQRKPLFRTTIEGFLNPPAQ